MNLKRIIYITIILIFTYHLFSQTIQKKESSVVKIELNKNEYNQGDTIKVIISNFSKDTFEIVSIHFTSDCIKLKMKKEKEWEQLTIQYFSGGIHHGFRHPFLPGEVINYEWNQSYVVKTNKVPITRETVPKGMYRFEFHFTTSRKNPNSTIDSYVSYSEEFEITKFENSTNQNK